MTPEITTLYLETFAKLSDANKQNTVLLRQLVRLSQALEWHVGSVCQCGSTDHGCTLDSHVRERMADAKDLIASLSGGAA